MADDFANLRALIRKRHFEPWNWLVQCASAVLLCLGLWMDSWPVCALAVAGLGCSLLPIPLPPMEHTGLAGLGWRIQGVLEGEENWLERPWTRGKRLGLGLCLALAVALAWALVAENLALLLFVFGLAVLLRVHAKDHAAAAPPAPPREDGRDDAPEDPARD